MSISGRFSLITSQRISELMRNLDNNNRCTFFNRWAKKFMKKYFFLCYNITSHSWNIESNEYLSYGYKRDGEAETDKPRLSFGTQEHQIPVYYVSSPGNKCDVLHTSAFSLKCLNCIDSQL